MSPLVVNAMALHRVHGQYNAAEVLQEFLDDIEVTGGAVVHDDGNVAPAADPTWTNLGPVYLKACVALGRVPVLEPSGLADADEAEDRPW